MNMKKIIVLLFLGLASLQSATAQDQVVVDANAILRNVEKDFNKIKVSGSIKLVISQGNDIALALSASEDKYIVDIRTVVENNTLKISQAGDSWGSSKNRQLTVYLSVKELVEIQVAGAANVIGSGEIKTEKLKINLSGASQLRADLSVQMLTMDLSGASKAKLNGKAAMLDIECSGASDVNFFELDAETCNATASGASDMEINVSKELNATASGASHIFYKGGAVANVKASGVSKIAKRN